MNKMTVKINGVKWTIEFVNTDDGRLETNLGITLNVHRHILIDKNLKEPDLSNTLTHELVHAFMWEYGFSQVEFNHENICDFIAIYGKKIIDMSSSISKKLYEVKQ